MLHIVPQPPSYSIDWDLIEKACPWTNDLSKTEQNPLFHPEGNVWTHTQMVCEALIANHQFRHQYLNTGRDIMFLAALLHDIGKSRTSYVEDGHIKTKNHSSAGAKMARSIMYADGVPFSTREAICGIVQNHMRPGFWTSSPNFKYLALKIAAETQLDLLRLICLADLRGRGKTYDCALAEEEVEYFFDYCENELGLLRNPLPFFNNHSKFLYFRNQDAEPYNAFHKPRCNVIVMSGLPGAGKDYWIQKNCPNMPVVSLDNIRRERRIKPTDEQGEVIAEAYARAKNLLRDKTNFVWNGTNVTKQIRSKIIDLLAAYDANIKIVHIECPYRKLISQNENREHSVPRAVIEKLIDKWEVPSITEAHEVQYVVGD